MMIPQSQSANYTNPRPASEISGKKLEEESKVGFGKRESASGVASSGSISKINNRYSAQLPAAGGNQAPS